MAGFFLQLGSELRRFCGGVRWEKLGDGGERGTEMPKSQKNDVGEEGKIAQESGR